MRVSWCVVALLVAGCDKAFLDAPDIPKYCKPEPVVEDLDSDSDGDGALARDDNCQMVRNVGQFDEDLDCRGDACDICPWRGDVDNAKAPDIDGDGIPDACDRAEQDFPTFFDGFNEASTRWTVFAGEWELGDGVWHQRAAGFAHAREGTQVSNGAVHIGLRVPDELLASKRAFRAGGYFHLATASHNRVVLARDEGDDRLWLRFERVAQDSTTTISQALLRASPQGRLVRIDYDYSRTGEVIGEISFDGVSQGMVTGTASTSGGYTGLVAIDVVDFAFYAHLH